MAIINRSFNWNKYKGKTIKEVINLDISYFIWCVKQGYGIDGSVIDYINNQIRDLETLKSICVEVIVNPEKYKQKKEEKEEPFN